MSCSKILKIFTSRNILFDRSFVYSFDQWWKCNINKKRQIIKVISCFDTNEHRFENLFRKSMFDEIHFERRHTHRWLKNQRKIFICKTKNDKHYETKCWTKCFDYTITQNFKQIHFYLKFENMFWICTTWKKKNQSYWWLFQKFVIKMKFEVKTKHYIWLIMLYTVCVYSQ